MFPTNEELVLSYVEESGEFIKAILDQKSFKCSSADVLVEGVQACAMIVRLLEEGDQAFPFNTKPLLDENCEVVEDKRELYELCGDQETTRIRG